MSRTDKIETSSKKYEVKCIVEIFFAILLLVIPIILIIYVFPHQIPKGFSDDISSETYPIVIMSGWIVCATIWLGVCLFKPHKNHADDKYITPTYKTALIFGTIILGFVLFVAVGFLVSSFVTIVLLSYISNERGRAPWILGTIIPLAVYCFLLFVLNVRLPTIFNL